MVPAGLESKAKVFSFGQRDLRLSSSRKGAAGERPERQRSLAGLAAGGTPTMSFLGFPVSRVLICFDIQEKF